MKNMSIISGENRWMIEKRVEIIDYESNTLCIQHLVRSNYYPASLRRHHFNSSIHFNAVAGSNLVV